MARYLVLWLVLVCSPAWAATEYWRVAGINDGTTTGTPASFDFVLAYEPAGEYGLVLSHDLFPQTDTVTFDVTQPLLNFSFGAESGESISVVDGVLGIYDGVDADGNSLRGFYTVTVLPYRLLIQEAPLPTLGAKLAPTNTARATAIKLARKLRTAKYRG